MHICVQGDVGCMMHGAGHGHGWGYCIDSLGLGDRRERNLKCPCWISSLLIQAQHSEMNGIWLDRSDLPLTFMLDLGIFMDSTLEQFKCCSGIRGRIDRIFIRSTIQSMFSQCWQWPFHWTGYMLNFPGWLYWVGNWIVYLGILLRCICHLILVLHSVISDLNAPPPLCCYFAPNLYPVFLFLSIVWSNPFMRLYQRISLFI